MTINAAPNPAYEAWCEEQPTGVEWNGDYVECMYPLNGRLVQAGGFTRYRGGYDFPGYGECFVERGRFAPHAPTCAELMGV